MLIKNICKNAIRDATPKSFLNDRPSVVAGPLQPFHKKICWELSVFSRYWERIRSCGLNHSCLIFLLLKVVMNSLGLIDLFHRDSTVRVIIDVILSDEFQLNTEVPPMHCTFSFYLSYIFKRLTLSNFPLFPRQSKHFLFFPSIVGWYLLEVGGQKADYE